MIEATVTKPPLKSKAMPATLEPAEEAVASAAPVALAEKASPVHRSYGDPIRVLGTIAVVIGHVCDMAVFNKETAGGDWWVCNYVDAATRWAVPVYIMLSGALLLAPERNEPPLVFYRKRLARLGIAIAFWSAFFIWFATSWTGWSTPEQAVRDLLLGKPYAHLHFIFRIMGLYLFTPMFRVFLKNADRRLVVLTVLVTLGLGSLNSLMDGLTGTELSAFLRFAPFVGYYFTGYLLRDRKLSKREVTGCWMLALACVAILAGGTGLLVQYFGLKGYPSPGMLLYDFLSPVRVAFGVASWLLLTHYFDEGWQATMLGRFVSQWLAPATMGIYLVHPFFRDVLHMKGYEATHPNVWLGIPMISLMVYVPSAIFAIVVMRIPVVKKIVV